MAGQVVAVVGSGRVAAGVEPVSDGKRGAVVLAAGDTWADAEGATALG